MTAASAATLGVRDGRLFGASGTIVNGATFDVAFPDGTCIALLDGCDEVTDFAFGGKPSDGLAAGGRCSIRFSLTVCRASPTCGPTEREVGGDLVDIRNRIEPLTYGRPFGAFGIAGLALVTNERSIDEDDLFDGNGPGSGLGRGFDTNLSDAVVFARFTAADIAPVPLPAALPLSLAGLIALGLARRRRGRRRT